MSTQYKNIKCACGLESIGKLAFLDVNISRDSNIFSTAGYTGLTTKLFSFIPIKYKTNLINILTNRAYKISKSYLTFKDIGYY